MGSKRRLLIIARRFPYNHGEVAAEAYLETEIKLLSPFFDEIVAVGTEASVRDRPTCLLPENVRPVALGCGNSKIDKALEMAQGSLLRISGPDYVKETLRSEDTLTSHTENAFLSYFVARAYRKQVALMKLLYGIKFQPTHIYSFWLWDTALVAVWTKKSYGHSIAFSRAHRYDLYRYSSSLDYLPLRAFLLKNLDYVFPCSIDGKNYINDNWSGYEEKIRTAYLGTRELADRSNAPDVDTFRLVSCSRVVPVKRVKLIADALATLDKGGAKLSWTHFGDGEELDVVKEKAYRFEGISCSFPGNLPNEQLLNMYATHDFDLFVNVSASEGLPLSIMEACGAGIPVLATDVGGTSEIVHENINGSLLPKEITAEELATAIDHFSGLDEHRRRELRMASRRIWEEHFRASRNVERMVKVILGDD